MIAPPSLVRRERYSPLWDLHQSLVRTAYWLALGWYDVKLRYRGSLLGPLWITLSMAIFVAALGAVYTRLFGQPPERYVPFLATGLILWNFVTAVVLESVDAFVAGRPWFTNMATPRFLFICRALWRNLVILSHNLAVYLAVILWYGVDPWPQAAWFVPGFLLVLVNLFWLAALLALLGTRFRDLPPILTAGVMVAFLVSPITWMPAQIGARAAVLVWNPVLYAMDVTRGPLLGQAPAAESFAVLAATACALAAATLVLYRWKGHRVPFWL